MNFIDAMKAAREGRLVRRPLWDDRVSMGFYVRRKSEPRVVRYFYYDVPVNGEEVSDEDIFAEDWQIVEDK